MIKILHLVNNLGAGGAERQLYYIAKYTSKALFSHEIYSMQGKGTLDKQFNLIGTPVHHLFLENSSFNLKTCSKLQTLYRYLIHHKIDILHAWLYHPNFYAAILRVLVPHLRLIVSKRNQPFWYTKKHFVLNRVVYRIADAILVNSQSIKASILDYVPVEKKIYCIPNIVDIPTNIDPMAIAVNGFKRSGKFVVGIVGRFAPQKQQITILKALKHLKEKIPELMFVFVGDGVEMDSCREFSKNEGLNEHVFFAGYQENVLPWFKGFDIYVLASSHEGLPNTILEAQGIGVPTIATNVGGVPDVIKDGENGLLINHSDPVEIENAIFKLYTHPELRRKLRENGLGKIKRHSVDKIESYETLYLSIVKNA